MLIIQRPSWSRLIAGTVTNNYAAIKLVLNQLVIEGLYQYERYILSYRRILILQAFIIGKSATV